MKLRLALAGLCAAPLILSGCSTPATTSAPTPQWPSATTASASAPASPAAGDTQAFLAKHGLAGLSVEQIVEKLEIAQDDRAKGPMGSVRPSELILTDPATQQKVSLPTPKDKFYLSMAPYVASTHECFNHNLATCRGEIVDKTVHVLLKEGDKTVLDQDIKTYPNGFAGAWVPKNIKGTLTVSHDGRSVTVPVSTGEQDPTCITTPLKLA